MNKGDNKNCGHWVQIITTIPEISFTDHRHSQTTDKRILYATSAVFSIKLNWKKSNSSCNYQVKINLQGDVIITTRDLKGPAFLGLWLVRGYGAF